MNRVEVTCLVVLLFVVAFSYFAVKGYYIMCLKFYGISSDTVASVWLFEKDFLRSFVAKTARRVIFTILVIRAVCFVQKSNPNDRSK